MHVIILTEFADLQFQDDREITAGLPKLQCVMHLVKYDTQ